MLAGIWSLIGGLKGAAIIAAIIALCAWIGTQQVSLSRAQAARDTAIAQRDAAAGERDKAIETALKNETTIKELRDEKDLINTALNGLRAAQTTNRNNTVTREVVIQRESSLPANIAQAAPVLRTIISEVQVDRYRRRGITPPVIETVPAAKVNQ